MPSDTDLSGFKFGDQVELVDVTFMCWTMIDADAYGNFADSDVKVTVAGIKKKGVVPPPEKSK